MYVRKKIFCIHRDPTVAFRDREWITAVCIFSFCLVFSFLLQDHSAVIDKKRASTLRHFAQSARIRFPRLTTAGRKKSQNRSHRQCNKAVKVFARLFQKAAQSRARSPRRCPQTAKSFFSAFLFCQAFFFAPTWSKKKAALVFALFPVVCLSSDCPSRRVHYHYSIFFSFLQVFFARQRHRHAGLSFLIKSDARSLYFLVDFFAGNRLTKTDFYGTIKAERSPP